MACPGSPQQRHVLCFMLFTGFMVTFLLRINLNFAIVAMVQSNSSSNSSMGSEVGSDLFDWDEVQQSVILSSFFWGYLPCQIPGGRIAEVYGTKRVFGGSVLITGLLSILAPQAAQWHWTLLLIIRALQGMAQGVVFPCLSAAAAVWAPPKERATFVSYAIQGCSLGTVLALPLCGWVLTQWGWPAVFYVSGLIAIVWFVAWLWLVYDSPQRHPRITADEKLFIESQVEPLKKAVNDEKAVPAPVPWVAIFTSLQFWLGAIAGIGNDWGFHMVCNFVPKYMKGFLEFDIEKSSWLSSLPFLSQYVFALAYASFCDYLIRRKVPTRSVRKLSVIISHIGPATGLLVLTGIAATRDVVPCIVILTLSVSAIGAMSCGFFQNPLDIAPNYAGTLTGITNTLGALTAVVSTPLTGATLQGLGLLDGWRVVFCTTAVMYIVTSLPYLWLATGQKQPWNRQADSDGDEALSPVA